MSRFLGINLRTIQGWMKRWREGDRLEPKTHVPRQRKINKEALKRYIQENPNHTFKEMKEVFHVAQSLLCRSLKKLSITLKKGHGV